MQKAKDIVITEKLIARFWSKVSPGAPDACWPWEGSLSHEGYGLLYANATVYRAHRVSYCLRHGVTNLPDGYEPDHLCRNRVCVNWTHLDAVTHAVNTQRGINRACLDAYWAARTHCRKGHILTTENSYRTVHMRGGHAMPVRVCRTCKKVNSLKRLQEASTTA